MTTTDLAREFEEEGTNEMNITESRQGTVQILSVQGSLDVVTSPTLENKLNELIDAGEKSVLLDLGKLDYVSSAGLRVFISALKKIQSLGGHLVFCSLIKQVKQIFDIAGLSLRVKLFPSVEEAVKGFPGGV